MAGTDGIRDIYRISGVTAGGGYAFSRLRIRRKPAKHQEGEGESRQNEEQEETFPPEKDSSAHVDIEA